jgi:hypothetical protein
VVATELHRESLLERLLLNGLNAAAAIKQGLYIPLDVDGAISTFMVNDLPDSVRFLMAFGDLLSSAAKAQKDPERFSSTTADSPRAKLGDGVVRPQRGVPPGLRQTFPGAGRGTGYSIGQARTSASWFAPWAG